MRNTLKVLSINILLLCLGIIIIEIIFGSWRDPNILNRLNLIKNAEISYDISELYDWDDPVIKYTRDEYGLRGNFSSPRDVDILTIGGSTTDQRYIGDGHTWQDVTQDQFTKSGGKVIVANAGVDGQSTFGHIKNFEWWLPYISKLKPRYILFYVGLNDFYKDADFAFDDLINDKKGKSIKQILKERSAVYYLYRTLKGTYRAIFVLKIGHRSLDFDKMAWVDEPVLNRYDEVMSQRLASYSARLEVLVELTRKLGAEPIFVTQPSRKYDVRSDAVYGIKGESKYDDVKYNGVDYYHMMRLMDDAVLKTCARHQLICFDLSNDLAESWENEDFYDFEHMTPAGAKKVGLYLHQKLKEMLGGSAQKSAR